MEPLLASALGTRVKIDIALDGSVPAIHVDAAQIEMIVLNIAINARDAMPSGGTLRIATSAEVLPASANPDSPPPGCYVCLRMTDDGAGMSPDVLARAFEPYFSTKPQGTGSGLGLSQVYGIARQSGGQARIESTLGVGTSVIVHLPCEAGHEPGETPTEAVQERAQDKSCKRATLLVVDDDHAVRSTTAMLLRRSGYTVTEAEGGDAALSILAHDGSIELLITDVVMPKMNGAELAAKASELRPELPILFLSGYADPQGGTIMIPLAQLVRKPFRPVDLIGLIEQTLSARAGATVGPDSRMADAPAGED
jgi:CheY-like chemotaxis protein/anti-sigma regulatory factor (Ser/Thr protein kinase)